MPSSFCWPPVECSRGTTPIQAANSRPLWKAAPLPIAAMSAVAVTGPMPGMATSLWQASFSRTLFFISASASSTLMSLFSQGSAKKMRTSAGFHANQLDVHVRGEAQQLGARELLAHHNLAAQVKPDQMKNCLTKINADGV